MIPSERLQQITERFEYLEAAMSAGGGDIAALAKEYSELRPVVEQISAYQQLLSDLAEAEEGTFSTCEAVGDRPYEDERRRLAYRT